MKIVKFITILLSLIKIVQNLNLKQLSSEDNIVPILLTNSNNIKT